MSTEIKVPVVGESITEVTVAQWMKSDGDFVEMDEVICEMESEKATFELNATRHYGGYALRKLFHESDRLLMVKYVSPTCGPCRTLKPILDKVVDEYEGKIYFVEIDIVEDPEIAKMGQVIGTPTVQFFHNQELVKEMKGIKQKSQYREVIDSYVATTVS